MVDESNNQRINAERMSKSLEKQLNDLVLQLDQANARNEELTNDRLRVDSELNKHKTDLEESITHIAALNKTKQELTCTAQEYKQVYF